MKSDGDLEAVQKKEEIDTGSRLRKARIISNDDT